MALSVPAALAFPFGGAGIFTNHATPTTLPPPAAAVSPAYMVVTADGQVVPFGDAGNFGSFLQPPPSAVAPPSESADTTTSTTSGETESSASGSPAVASTGSASSTDVPESAPQDPVGWSPVTAGSPVVASAVTPDSGGYWLVTAAGGVYTFGDATFAGSLAGNAHSGEVVGFAPTLDGKGYWIATSTGGVFTFGDAPYLGSVGDLDPARPMGGTNAVVLGAPIAAMATTPDGKGYWLVGSDGGILTFGDAAYFGSPYQLSLSEPPGGTNSAEPLDEPIVGIAPTSDGKGYWLVGSDGGIFTFGDAAYFGSPYQLDTSLPPGGANSAEPLARPITGIAPTSDGKGYWLVGSDGGIFTFGDASFSGSAAGMVEDGDSAVGVVADQPYVDGGSAAAREAVEFALSQVGQPYLYGGTGDGGYDCSGLVMVSYEHAGVQLPRTAQEQYDATTPVPAGVALLPGDLLFFGTSTQDVTHVGIYIGNGEMVDAPHTGTDVTVESYQWDDYLGATRPAP